jgi:hypothetical protein
MTRRIAALTSTPERRTTVKVPLQTPRKSRLRNEDVAFVRHSVTRACGLRPDLARLEDVELSELRALVLEIRSGADQGVERSSPEYLDAKAQRRWEQLVEKAAEKPGWFSAQRARAKRDHEQQQKKMTPSRQPRWEQPGVIAFPPLILQAMQEGNLGAVHLLVLMVVLAAIENKCDVHAYMRYDEDGSVVVNAVENLVRPLDLEGDVSHVGLAVQELAESGLLVVERQGFVRIRLGSLLTDALAERRAA